MKRNNARDLNWWLWLSLLFAMIDDSFRANHQQCIQINKNRCCQPKNQHTANGTERGCLGFFPLRSLASAVAFSDNPGYPGIGRSQALLF